MARHARRICRALWLSFAPSHHRVCAGSPLSLRLVLLLPLSLSLPAGVLARGRSCGANRLRTAPYVQAKSARGRRPDAADSGAADAESEADVVFEGGYRLPGRLWNGLFKYQKTCIKWLWELHCQNTGGIVADEVIGIAINVLWEVR